MKRFTLALFTLIFTISLFVFSGCNSQAINQTQDNNKLKIVTSIFPYYDFARSIAKDKADIKLLLSPGSEPHSYEPTPSDIIAIENCDIFIYNGGESDEWVENVIESVENKNIKTMCMMDYVKVLYEESIDHKKGDEYDEHIWTSLKNAQSITSAITNEIIKADNTNKEYYKKNSNNYIDELKNIDNKFAQAVSKGKRNVLVYGDRFPFLYFVNDYNLKYECAFPGCSSETEPSIATVSHLIDYVRENKIPAVFYVDFSNGKIAKIISEDSTAKNLHFYSAHNVTKEQFENGETYISLMELNLKSIKEALS